MVRMSFASIDAVPATAATEARYRKRPGIGGVAESVDNAVFAGIVSAAETSDALLYASTGCLRLLRLRWRSGAIRLAATRSASLSLV